MLQGTLDEFPLIDVLGILKARNKTGRLDIERQAGRGLIYVRLGEPYYAESSLTRSLIGQKLVDIGAITDMQLRKALDRQAESGDRLGQVLLTHGVISREHIASAVISQIKDALADLLAWETGEFRWEVGAEVEVEVPVHGGMLDSGNGSIPMAPHVVPVTSSEPVQAPPVAQPIQGPEHAQPDFRQSGSALNGSAATAPQIDQSPRFEPQVQPQLEVVHSHSVGGGSTDEESPPVPFDQAAAEPELHTAVDETEQQEASEMVDGNRDVDETIEFEAPEPVEESAQDEPYGAESHEDESYEAEPFESQDVASESHEEPAQDEPYEAEDIASESHEEPVEDEPYEPVEEESAESESVEAESAEDKPYEAESNYEPVDEPVEDAPYEAESVEDAPYEAESAEDASNEEPVEESVEDEPYEAESPDEPVEGDSDHDSPIDAGDEQPHDEFHEVVELPRVEVVESLNGTRVIKSNPAPEFDEEFDQMFATSAEVIDEQADEPEAPSFETEPEAPSFETGPGAESPLDEVPFLGAEIAENATLEEAPSFEPAGHSPVASFGFAPVEHDPIAEIPQSPVPPSPEPMAANPPPPPPATAAPLAPMAQVSEATEGRSNDDAGRGVPGEPASDIKLDRSSLVRELSDLLR